MDVMTLPDWFTYKSRPYLHQDRTTRESLDREHYGLWWEVGCGKSKVVLDQAAYHWRERHIDTLLVIAPNGVHRQWVADEVPLHLPEWCPSRTMAYRSGRLPAATQDVLKERDRLRIISMNIEALSHKSGMAFALEVMNRRNVMVALDESHRIKTPSSKRTRNVLKLGAEAAVRRSGTGTEITEGLEDLYTQAKFLSAHILGIRTYTEFKMRYCIMVGQFNTIVGYRDQDELLTKLAPHVSVVEKKDCLDLPERTYLKREVVLSDEQRRLYTQLRDDFITELASGQILEAPLAITRLMRLQQVVSGHVPREGGGWDPLPCPRIDACVEEIEQVRGKVIVWLRFRPESVMLGEALRKANIGYVEYNGGTSAAQKTANLARFKTDPKVKVFLASQGAAGTGLTINEAATAIYYSHEFSYEKRVQSEGRNHRIGQTERVTYVDLVAPGTVDLKVLRALRQKGEVAKLTRDPELFKRWLQEPDDVDV